MNREAWRNQIIETALDPDMPIIDAHQHIWIKSPAEPWEAYPPDQVIADKTQSGHNIVATVYVDSRAHYKDDGPAEFRCVGETAYAEQVANDCMHRGNGAEGVCAAIISYADLKLGGAVGPVLDAHTSESGRFRGIRYMTAMDLELPPVHGGTELGIMMHPIFRSGFAELARRDLCFDAWVFHPQIPELVDLAYAFAETRIILDHLGGPLLVGRYADRQEESFAEWRRNMATLAECPNVFLKLGGLNTSTTGMAALDKPAPNSSETTAEMQRRYILTAIDIFGPNRCMFESNFPVDMVSISYKVLWNAFKQITADFSHSERRNLFSGTAARAYRIPEQELSIYPNSDGLIDSRDFR